MRQWDEYEKYRKEYTGDIPAEAILGMLATLAWSTAEDYNYDPPPLVTFKPTPPDSLEREIKWATLK
jgi:hypothetical protein